MRRRENDKPQESWMKLALHATEPATRYSAGAHLIEYDLAELIARIEARISAASRETKLSVGSLELDLIERTAKRGDRPIDLLPREFRLLEPMIRREGRVLTRQIPLRPEW